MFWTRLLLLIFYCGGSASAWAMPVEKFQSVLKACESRKVDIALKILDASDKGYWRKLSREDWKQLNHIDFKIMHWKNTINKIGSDQSNSDKTDIDRSALLARLLHQNGFYLSNPESNSFVRIMSDKSGFIENCWITSIRNVVPQNEYLGVFKSCMQWKGYFKNENSGHGYQCESPMDPSVSALPSQKFVLKEIAAEVAEKITNIKSGPALSATLSFNRY